MRYGVILRSDQGGGGLGGGAAARLRGGLLGRGVACTEARVAGGEVGLLKALAAAVQQHDPDILLAWDVRRASLGYALERAAVLGMRPPLVRLLGRMPDSDDGDARARRDPWGEQHGSMDLVCGRLVLNVWRSARAELKLTSYTLDNVAAKLLTIVGADGRPMPQRVPAHTHRSMTLWWDEAPAAVPPAASRLDAGRLHVLRHYATVLRTTLLVVARLEVISRTSEHARVFGIDFHSVLVRGSQYRVESMLLRLARTQDYALPATNKEQVRGQSAIECQALNFDPEGTLYSDPAALLSGGREACGRAGADRGMS